MDAGLFISVFWIVAMALIMGTGWYLYGRDRKVGTVVTEFAPPDDLRPAEISMLIRHQLTWRDIGATIVDLACRGHLEIVDMSGSISTLGSIPAIVRRTIETQGLATVVRRTRPMHDALGDTDLRPFERILLTRMFAAGPEVSVAALQGKFQRHASDVRDALMNGLAEKGYFEGHPGRVRVRWFLLGLGGSFALLAAMSAIPGLEGIRPYLLDIAILDIVYAFIGFFALVGKYPGIGVLSASFFALYVVAEILADGQPYAFETFVVFEIILVFSFLMSRWTPKGTESVRRAKGYMRYIKGVERHRTEWKEKENEFTGDLGYAIAFGVGGKWASIFSKIESSERKRGILSLLR